MTKKSNIEIAFEPMVDHLYNELVNRFQEAYDYWIQAASEWEPTQYTEEELSRYTRWGRPTRYAQIKNFQEKHQLGIRYTRSNEGGSTSYEIAQTKGVYFHREFAEKEALEIAKAQYQSFIAKFQNKVGDLEEVEIKWLHGADCVITGKAGEKFIRIDQQTVWKVSKLGTHYAQFPARIYIDGQFYSAEKYKDVMQG